MQQEENGTERRDQCPGFGDIVGQQELDQSCELFAEMEK